jgi:hypothetical protein
LQVPHAGNTSSRDGAGGVDCEERGGSAADVDACAGPAFLQRLEQSVGTIPAVWVLTGLRQHDFTVPWQQAIPEMVVTSCSASKGNPGMANRRQRTAARMDRDFWMRPERSISKPLS